MVIHDFLHADLHFGNWKVIEETNGDIKLLIYDCGIMCRTGNKSINKEILENTLNRRNFIKLLDYLEKVNPDIKITTDHKKELESTIRFDISSAECLRSFLSKLIDLQILKDENFIRLLTSIAIIGETPSKSVSAITKYIYSNLNSNTILYHIHYGLLNKMNKFHDLKKYYNDKIENNEEYKKDYSDWLFQEFGHRKGNILDSIIYNRFFSN